MQYLWYHYFKLDVIYLRYYRKTKYLNIPYFIPLNVLLLLITGTKLWFLMIHLAQFKLLSNKHTITQFILYEKLSNPFDVLTKYVILNNALICTVLLRDEMLVTWILSSKLRWTTIHCSHEIHTFHLSQI